MEAADVLSALALARGADVRLAGGRHRPADRDRHDMARLRERLGLSTPY
jgi:hypothetical protein